MADENTKSEAAPKSENEFETPPPPPPPPRDRRKAIGALLSILIIVGAIVLTLYVWSVIENHPGTDDAVARANVIGIVPRVQGPIVKLHVVENQAVKAGELLFEIDPEDYELAVEKAKANLDALDKEIEVARVQDKELAIAVKVAEAGVERAKAQLKQTQDTLERLEPLLKQRFTTAEQVDQARTARNVAATAVETEQQRLNQAKIAVSKLDTLTAQRPGLVATLKLSELELSYCKVTAPFPGRVI